MWLGPDYQRESSVVVLPKLRYRVCRGQSIGERFSSALHVTNKDHIHLTRALSRRDCSILVRPFIRHVVTTCVFCLFTLAGLKTSKTALHSVQSIISSSHCQISRYKYFRVMFCFMNQCLRPASWSSGQSFWLLITRCRVRFQALPWGFSLWGKGPRGDHGLGSQQIQT